MRKSPAETGTLIPRNSAVFFIPLFLLPCSRLLLFPKPIVFTVAVILTQGGAGVRVGLKSGF